MHSAFTQNLKETENSFFPEKILDLAGIAGWKWKPGEDRIFWTDGMFKILKLKKADGNFMRFRDLHQYVSPEALALIHVFASESLEEQINLEFSCTDTDGKVIPVSGVLKKNTEGVLRGTVTGAFQYSNFQGQTLKSLEELNDELKMKNKELDRINTELTSFSYVAGHDLQEPLRKIQAFVSLILAKDAGRISESSQEHFNRIQKAAGQMQQMIDGLLTYSRANTNSRNFETVNLESLFSKIISKFWEEIQKSKAIVEIKNTLMLRIIPNQLEQLLAQLISNALKFQKEGSRPHIIINSTAVSGYEITGEVVQRNKTYICISVADNGIGFDMGHLETIFQLFNRLHGKTEFSGAGTGLAICRRIAQNHNGFISAESEQGKGSVFKVYIPES